MTTHAAPLLPTVTALRSGELDLLSYIDQALARVEAQESQLQALVPEADRRVRLRREALDLQARYPDPANRPPLYGVLLGVKDIFRTDGFPTRAGSAVPPEALAGAEASSVRRLRAAGALVLGKTVTAEFAFADPGPTRNPHNLAHTPGGSSSGSAAGVAAGYFPLATGTQTIGSVIRPAAYCGVVGFKPSYGRIATDGVLPVSTALDHVGLFTQDVAGMELAASLLCDDWQTLPLAAADQPLPVLGIPVGAYLDQAEAEGRAVFEAQIARLEAAGYTIREVPIFADINTIAVQTRQVMAFEMAQAHADLYPRFGQLYRPNTLRLIQLGQSLTPDQYAADLDMQRDVRATVIEQMSASGIDLWIAPAATGAAPISTESTGDSAMNLPWTLVGLPVLGLPTSSRSAEELPFGVQIIGTPMNDEQVIRWGERIAPLLAGF